MIYLDSQWCQSWSLGQETLPIESARCTTGGKEEHEARLAIVECINHYGPPSQLL